VLHCHSKMACSRRTVHSENLHKHVGLGKPLTAAAVVGFPQVLGSFGCEERFLENRYAPKNIDDVTDGVVKIEQTRSHQREKMAGS
jgi:hypothetical protein